MGTGKTKSWQLDQLRWSFDSYISYRSYPVNCCVSGCWSLSTSLVTCVMSWELQQPQWSRLCSAAPANLIHVDLGNTFAFRLWRKRLCFCQMNDIMKPVMWQATFKQISVCRVTSMLCFILFSVLSLLFYATLTFCLILSIFYSILSHLINLYLKLLFCISTLALFIAGFSYMDKSCAWSTASVIKLSAESAVPCCNFCWWWTQCKQILSSSSCTHSGLPVLPALPRSAHSAVYADESGRRRDNSKCISWGSDINRVTALCSK